MADMVSKLSEFYKPSREVAVSLDIHQVLDDVLLLVKKHLQKQRIILEKHYSADLPQITAVEGELKQVFLNLINNSVDAIPETGGRITVVTQTEADNIQVLIQDSGEGILPENMGLIFEPFFTTKSIKGTGLGLSVSYGIIKKHGGDIRVKSQPSEGTTFIITLPIKYPGKSNA